MSEDGRDTIQILKTSQHNGTSKAGKPYSMTRAQCVIRDGYGNIAVGELILPKELEDPGPGVYVPKYGVAVDMTRTVVGRLVALERVS